MSYRFDYKVVVKLSVGCRGGGGVLGPGVGTVAPVLEGLEVFFTDVFALEGFFDKGVIVCEGAELDVAVFEGAACFVEVVGEDGYHAEYVGSGVVKAFCC